MAHNFSTFCMVSHCVTKPDHSFCIIHSCFLFVFERFVLSVTGLPYPVYKSYDYRIVEGSCSENGNRTLAAKDLVQITCQYECDTSPSCVGFLFSSTADKACVHLLGRGCVPAVDASRWRTYLKITTNSSETLE